MNKILREDQSLVDILAGVNSCAFLPVVSYAVYDICYNGDPSLVAQAVWAFSFVLFAVFLLDCHFLMNLQVLYMIGQKYYGRCRVQKLT
eukprot:UN10599